MAANSKIEWTDATWNPITGCTLVSEGCRHCYAARLAATRLKHEPSRAGLARLNAAGEAKFTGEVRLNEKWLDQPLRWRAPKRIFVCAHGDLFHEGVPDEWIDRVFAVMALCPQHTFQVLTKRPERMRKYLTDPASAGRTLDVASVLLRRHFDIPDNVPAEMLAALDPFPWPLPHIWLGVSVEDQAAADARIPHLLAVPAKVRFLSCEPLLGPVDLRRVEASATGNLIEGTFAYPKRIDALTGKAGHYPGKSTFHPDSHTIAAIDWVICGGESGPGARPMHPAWARALRDQCAAAAGVAFFMKQMTKKAPIPADLMVREFPDAR